MLHCNSPRLYKILFFYKMTYRLFIYSINNHDKQIHLKCFTNASQYVQLVTLSYASMITLKVCIESTNILQFTLIFLLV